LAAQAYSPSDAMSQARVCVDGMKKVQREMGISRPRLRAETGTLRGDVSVREDGAVLLMSRHRRPRCMAPCGGVVWWRGADRGLGRPRSRHGVAGRVGAAWQFLALFSPLFLARRIRLSRRNVGSRRRVRPDRRRHPRGFRRAAEAQEPGEEIGAMLLKHRQDGFGGDSLDLHAARHSASSLTESSDGTASTPKIVTTAPGAPLED
jgi:hypothetical protein